MVDQKSGILAVLQKKAMITIVARHSWTKKVSLLITNLAILPPRVQLLAYRQKVVIQSSISLLLPLYYFLDV